MNDELKNLLNQLYHYADNRDFYNFTELIKRYPRLQNEAYGDMSAIHIARDNEDLLKIILELGVSPDLRDSVGNSLLMDYSGLGNLNGLSLLLDFSADVNAKNYEGESPLSIAVARGKVTIAKRLLDAGADPNVKVGGVGLSTWASLSGSEAMKNWVEAIS